ncbi:MAG: IS3 family transposase [Candidatus Nomurabacteria bacterium]|nr:IS3 family transposase [Candidatus Nomurabacteria bacterium]
MICSLTTKVNKTKLAKDLGVSRSSLYYKRRREETDLELKRQIEAVMVDHKDYGHKRIAMDLKMGHNRIRRVMKKYNLKPYRRHHKGWVKKKDLGKPATGIPNLVQPLLEQKLLVKFNQVWCTDFTYIKFQGKFIYLATIIDLFNREIVGVNISRFHNRFLVVGALEDAVIHYGVVEIVHSDQGSEYDSEEFIAFVKIIGAKISMSEKASPWQNGHQESFFGHFKLEAGDLNRFKTIGELIEYIYQQVYYYNHKRIHSVLKMTPVEKRKRMTV